MIDEWDKDRIDLHQAGFLMQPGRSKLILNMQRIQPAWLREVVRQYLRQRIDLTAGSLCSQLSSFVWFSKFLPNFPEVKAPAQVNRRLIQQFISFITASRAELTNAPLGASRRAKILQNLGQLFDSQTDFPRLLIFKEDIPRAVRTTTPQWIPESVMAQLLAHQHALVEPYGAMLRVILEIGCRVGELCTLAIDCLSQDPSGDSYVTRVAHKQHKTVIVPISSEIAKVIQVAQLRAKAQYGEGVVYLFPKNALKPVFARTFNQRINDYIETQQITDDNGQLWHFTARQCRHTVATRLINSGVSQPTIQRFLGHETPRMTDVYAQIHDQTLKEAFFKYQNQIKTD